MMAMNLIFIAMMLGVHYPVAWFVTRRMLSGLDADVQREIRAAMAGRMRGLFAIWLLALATVTGAVLAFSDKAAGIVFPGALIGFHLLWWPFVVPILQGVSRHLERRGITQNSSFQPTRRMASLQPRRLSEYLSPWMRTLPWALGLSGVALIAWQLLAHTPDSGIGWLHGGVFGASGLFVLIAWNFGMRREAETGYAFPGGTVEAANKAQALRRFRILGFYWVHLAMAAGFFGAAVLGIEVDRGTITGETIGLYGAIVGTTVGVLGGIFGTWASVRANRAARS